VRLGQAAESDGHQLPKLFLVNWFRKEGGRFLWPGFGDNVRVLKWIAERCEGAGDGTATPIGTVPTPHALDTAGLDLAPDALDALLSVDPAQWRQEAAANAADLDALGDLPPALWAEQRALEDRLTC
jgi:phosphoenolpyruvate carboxykinase (GTP)